MRSTRPSRLESVVEATAVNRPIRIAYLVPFGDAPSSHAILDAVFLECYSRWGGAYTLILPVMTHGFASDGYGEWLKNYDPDFVYSYVEIDTTLVEIIDRLCCPIALLKHEAQDRNGKAHDWRSFLPDLGRYVQPISSMTTIHSAFSRPTFTHDEYVQEPTIFTQYGSEPASRLLADNFGTAFDVFSGSRAVPGFFRTLSLVPPELPAHVLAGTERCTSVVDALHALCDRRATPIAHFAMMNSDGMRHAEHPGAARAFRLFIGSTTQDRLNFWNYRLLGDRKGDSLGALVLEPSVFGDSAFVKQLGLYLNKHNFLGQGGAQYRVELHSSSLPTSDLEGIAKVLSPETYNSVAVSDIASAPMLPSPSDFRERVHGIPADATRLKLTDNLTHVSASEPAHFACIPPRFKAFAAGDWVVELRIQRHNNLSVFANVVDEWRLPRRRKIVRAFTAQLAKPTLSGRLALVPSSDRFALRSQPTWVPHTYTIELPADDAFFRHLALDLAPHSQDDLRASIQASGYRRLEISDKGQNLRGVVSLFPSLGEAFEVLTNKFWRSVLEKANPDSIAPLSFSLNELRGLLPNDRPTLDRLDSELRLVQGRARKYLEASLSDTLEHLVHLGVFFQVVQWQCVYCGHANSLNLDNAGVRNECSICATEYLLPIDVVWYYKLNDFVYRTLKKQCGGPVLWALGSLQLSSSTGSFWYLPEVSCYEQWDNPSGQREVDILAMLDGLFYVCEVKRSASLFYKDPDGPKKFAAVVNRLRPDVALLAFERYCGDGDDVDQARVALANAVDQTRRFLGPWSRLDVMVAQDIRGFSEFPAHLGRHGRRVDEFG